MSALRDIRQFDGDQRARWATEAPEYLRIVWINIF
jgi:hypothetical protein